MQNIHTPLTGGPLDCHSEKEKKKGLGAMHVFLNSSTCLHTLICVFVQHLCIAVCLTLQCHSAIFREFIGVKENSGMSIKRVLHIQHILVLETFVVEEEIPKNRNREKKGDKCINFVCFYLTEFASQDSPLIGVSVFLQCEFCIF